jgi:hypothetical protein
MTFENQSVNFNDLLTKGYVVVKSFLNNDIMELLVADYYKKQKTFNKNYAYYRMSDNVRMLLEKQILKTTDYIKEQNILNVDLTMIEGNYISTQGSSYDWHQDHEPWYIFQQSYQYLNFYIPIIKPNPNLSGLSIIPFDILETSLPEYVNNFKYKGASRCVASKNITLVHNDNEGIEYTMPIGIESISVTPDLIPGDLLLIRGDVIHKTQDTLTHRVSVSFRVTNGNALINKNLLITGCERKQRYIKGSPELYNSILGVFEKLGKDEITANELATNLRSK